MFLIEILIADAHCSGFHTKRLEAKRMIQIPSPDIFRIDA